MADIRSPRLLYLKGGLMLVVGLLASGLLIAEHPSGKVVFLLALAIWGFARAYYFVFYVIEHYIDGTYKYAGLIDFLKYAPGRWRHRRGVEDFPGEKSPGCDLPGSEDARRPV